MGKTPRVVFRPKRIAEGDWQIEAHFPGAEIRYITGLTDKADIDDWLGGRRKIAWLRSQGALDEIRLVEFCPSEHYGAIRVTPPA